MIISYKYESKSMSYNTELWLQHNSSVLRAAAVIGDAFFYNSVISKSFHSNLQKNSVILIIGKPIFNWYTSNEFISIKQIYNTVKTSEQTI